MEDNQKSSGGAQEGRKPFQGGRKPFGQGRKPFSSDRKPFSSDRRPFSGGRKPQGMKPGEKDGAGQAGEDRRPQQGRPFGRPANGERKPFGRPANGERKPFDGERKPFGRPANGERKPSDGERKPFGRPANGDRRSFRPDQKPPMRPMEPQDPLSGGARMAAWDVLNRVLLEEGYTALSLSDEMGKLRLSDRDKRLCTNIVYTTLENLLYLDFALDTCLADAEGVDQAIRNLLRLSAAQLFFMDRVPESAAVNEAVKLARQKGYEGLTGLVNGVLRSLIRQMSDIPWPDREDDVARFLSVRYSMPAWLTEKLVGIFGEEETESILKGSMKHRLMTLRPNFLLTNEEELEKKLHKKKDWRVERGRLPHTFYVSGTGDISMDEDFIKGLYSVQGEASMLAAEAVDVRCGMNVLDCCAAPGGKTAYMAEKMQNTGRVQAWDVHEHRVELIQKMTERLRIYNVRPMARDATVVREQMEKTMDAVLLDAPCSGTGVLHDKPDAKYRLNEERLQSLKDVQRKLMEACASYVKPGGVFVYSTCSILPEENAMQVESFLSDHPDFELSVLPAGIPEAFREKTGKYGLQLLPGAEGMDGFFISRMVRKKDA